MKGFFKIVVFTLLTLFHTSAMLGNDNLGEKKIIYEIELNDEVGSTSWRHIKSGLRGAAEENADYIILHLNTYGGAVDYADSIRTAIIKCQIPIYAFIDNNAASAGALIAIACDSIYMNNGANIGAATVVNGMDGAAMPDKYQSYMRSMMRSTAESHGKYEKVIGNDTTLVWLRDPLVAEAMVDAKTIVPGIAEDSTRVLTFTAKEALDNGFCEGIYTNEAQIITKHLGHNNYELRHHSPSKWDDLIGLLTNPAFQAILIMIMIGGIYFELQTPGIGFPSAAAIIAAILYFIPLYMTGTAADWEIILFVIGIIALILEIFVIPGFGVAGIAGIVCIFSSLVLAGLNNVVFSFNDVNRNDVFIAIATALFGIILAIVVIIWLTHKIGAKHGILRHTALQLEQKISNGYIGVPLNLNEQIGKIGTSLTVLRPSGKVEVDGNEYDAVSIDGFINANEQIIVVRTENAQLYVKSNK